MHDLDRTQNFFESDYEAYESDQFEFMDEGESYEGSDMEGELDEVEEAELAAELLEITDEEELDQFLGSLIKKAVPAVTKFFKSPIGQKLGGLLKGAAKKLLPMAGAALGNLVAPGVGGAIGGQLASKAGSMLGLEIEGLSAEDRQFEVARQFVRFANEAARQAAMTPPTAAPDVAATSAVVKAAQQYAPGLIQTNYRGYTSRDSYSGHGYTSRDGYAGRTGRWVRRGRKIVLYGV